MGFKGVYISRTCFPDEDSNRHWTKVSISGEGKEGDILEDLRTQEDMELTPKRVELEEVHKSLVHRSTQTDQMSLDMLEGKVDSLKGDMVNCMNNMFKYMKQFKELNRFSDQCSVIKKLEKGWTR